MRQNYLIFNNNLYVKINAASKGYPLIPFMANVIITELEPMVVTELFSKEYLQVLALMKKIRCCYCFTSTKWLS